MEFDLSEIGHYHRCMIVMGLIPGSTKKIQQRVQKIYTLLLLLSIFGVFVYGIHNEYKSMDLENNLMISLSIMTIYFIADMSMLTVILLQMVTKYDQHVEFINKSRQIYVKFLHKIGYKICSGVFGAGMRRKYGCTVAVLVAGLLVYMLIAAFNYFYGFFWYSLLFIIIIRAHFLQMSLYVDIMQNYLLVLNNQLQQIITIKLNKSLLLLPIDCSVIESLQSLLILKEIYTDIGQSVELYNEIFGWSIASIVICCCFGITVHMYWCFMSLDGYYQHQVFYSEICVLIPLSTILTVFCYNCEQLQRSNSKTKSLVKQLIVISNPEYKAVAHEFLLQICNRSLHVSAKGLFEADMEMLMMLGAYVASIMVILVQFSSAEFANREYRSKKNITY